MDLRITEYLWLLRYVSYPINPLLGCPSSSFFFVITCWPFTFRLIALAQVNI